MLDDHTPVATRVSVLGRLRVLAGNHEHDIDPSTQRGVVLSVLASRCNERIGLDELAEAVWPEGPSRTYRTGLRVVVQKLRELTDLPRSRGATLDSAIVGHAESYELRVRPEQVDTGRFEGLVREGLQRLSAGDSVEAALMLRQALTIWGEPFAGIDSVVLQPHIERLRHTRRSAQTGLIEADLQLGSEDLGELERAVADEPFDERRWGHLMIALFRRGRQADALSAFRRARRYLIDEIGVEPGPYLRKIESQILLQDEALLGSLVLDVEDDGPGWPTVPQPHGPLLLREDEWRTIDTLLRTWRVVTIAGPPGVGKTALAAAIGRTRDPAATAWIPLGDVPPGPGALIDLNVRLGLVTEVGADSVVQRRMLAELIGDQPLLLILDNAEHVVDAVTDVIAHLVRSCPNLTILVTSRRAIGTHGEQVYRLAPFDHLSDGATSAAAYLIERAGLRDVGPAERDALVRISAHVGGLAIGLEQAATRLQALSPGELVERLDLIDDGGADGLSRAISWSLALLSSSSMELLRALAQLDAPWPLKRAEAVGLRVGLDERAIASLVASLLEHSLVVDADPTTTPGDHRIIEPVRQFVRADSARMIDADQYPLACSLTVLAEVTAAARLLEGVDQAAGLSQLHQLMPDIRRTVIWGSEHDQPALVARLLGSLRAWWWASGLYGDGQTLYVLAAPVIEGWRPSTAEEHGWRLAALAAGVGTKPGFAPPAAYADALERWLVEAQRVGVSPAVRSWINQLLSCGMTFMNQQSARAEALAVAAIDDAHDAGDPWLAAWGRYALSVARGRTDPIAALAFFEQTIEAFASVGDRLNAARVTMFLGHGSRIFGDPRGSEQAFARAEAWCAELGAAPVTRLDCELGRAQGIDAAGDVVAAAEQYRALVPRLSALGDHRCAAVAERSLASLMATSGDLDGASALVAHAMEIFRSLEIEETEFATTFLVRAEIAEAREQWDLAARLLGAARRMSAGSGVPMELRDLDRVDALRRRLLDRLGRADLDDRERSGREDRFL